MQNRKKKPISITLAAALVICVVTFILGFVISSFAFVDSRIESANEKNAELQEIISTKEAEIKELNEIIDQKNENNIILGEQIQEHLATIESLNNNVANLQHDVDYISEAAINGTIDPAISLFAAFSSLNTSGQLIILVGLLVIIIFIISITCGIIASSTSDKKKDKKSKKSAKEQEEFFEESSYIEEEPADNDTTEALNDDTTSSDEAEATPEETPVAPPVQKEVTVVDEAIDLLYHNNLEDSISDLGGFRFGITNFDEVLSDKAKGKSFGNAENGDFVAFMSSKSSVKKLYIIPRYMTLSDSTVALRGITDLFTVTDEGGNTITHGTVKIKSIDAPAVFACGENGWAIESKGEITALGTRNY